MTKLIIPQKKIDIILDRAENNRCPICNKEFTKQELKEMKDIISLVYQDKSYLSKIDVTEVLVHNKHIKGEVQ